MTAEFELIYSGSGKVTLDGRSFLDGTRFLPDRRITKPAKQQRAMVLNLEPGTYLFRPIN